VGKKLKVSWKSMEGYEKRGRPYRVNEALVVDENGLEILRKLSHGTIASQQFTKENK